MQDTWMVLHVAWIYCRMHGFVAGHLDCITWVVFVVLEVTVSCTALQNACIVLLAT